MQSKLLRPALHVGIMCFFIIFLNSAGYYTLPANAGQDLQILRQWVNKDPFEKIGGIRLLDNKIFQNSFKTTVGLRIYKKFMEGYKGSKYFQSEDITEKNGIMTISIQDLAFDFYATIFIDTSKGWIDVCWNELSGIDEDHKPLNSMLFHDGYQVPVPYNQCQNISYDKAISQHTQKSQKENAINTSTTSKVAGQIESSSKHDNYDQKIVGTWRGVFHAKNSNGKPYTVDCEYVITKDKSNPDNYYFKQIDTLTFLDSTDTFSCSSKNSYSNSFDGQIVVNQENLKFIQKTVSNPRCGSLGTDYFRIAGDHLEVVNFNDGKVMTGVLIKQQ